MIQHIAIIIDGNRRWAKARSLMPWKGHEAGAETLDKTLDWCFETGIKEVTVYTLSTENLARDPIELKFLFAIFNKFFKNFKKDKRIKDYKAKIRFIGDLSLVPKNIQETAKEVEEFTKENNNFIVNFCFAYGGRLELVQAFNKLKNKEKITEKDIESALWLSSSPDLIIRTGGQVRLSNFLPWQSAYSEWLFLEKMWPEFTKQDLLDSIENFDSRKRNHGK